MSSPVHAAGQDVIFVATDRETESLFALAGTHYSRSEEGVADQAARGDGGVCTPGVFGGPDRPVTVEGFLGT